MSWCYRLVYLFVGSCIAGIVWICNSSAVLIQLMALLSANLPELTVDTIEGTLLNFTLHRVTYQRESVHATVGKVAGTINWYQLLRYRRPGWSSLLLQDVSIQKNSISKPSLKPLTTRRMVASGHHPEPIQTALQSFLSRCSFWINALSIDGLSVIDSNTSQELICGTIESTLRFEKNELILINPQVKTIRLWMTHAHSATNAISASSIQKISTSILSGISNVHFERLLDAFQKLPWEQFERDVDPLHCRSWFMQSLSAPFKIRLQNLQLFDFCYIGHHKQLQLEEMNITGSCYSSALVLNEVAIHHSAFTVAGAGHIHFGISYQAAGELQVQDLHRQQTLKAAWSAAPLTGLKIDAQVEGSYSGTAKFYAPLEPSNLGSTFLQFYETSKGIASERNLLGIAGIEGLVWYEREGYRWKINGSLQPDQSLSGLFATQGKINARQVEAELQVTDRSQDRLVRDWINACIVLPRTQLADGVSRIRVEWNRLPLPPRFLPDPLKAFWKEPWTSGILELSQPVRSGGTWLLELTNGVLDIGDQLPYRYYGSHHLDRAKRSTFHFSVTRGSNRLNLTLDNKTIPILKCELSAIALNELYPDWSGTLKSELDVEIREEGCCLKSFRMFGRELNWMKYGHIDAIQFEGSSRLSSSQEWRLRISRFNYLDRLQGNKLDTLLSIHEDRALLDSKICINTIEPTYRLRLQLDPVRPTQALRGIYEAKISGEIYLDSYIFRLRKPAYLSMDWMNRKAVFSKQIWEAKTEEDRHVIQVENGSFSLKHRELCGQFWNFPLKVGNPLLRPNHLELLGSLTGSWKYLHRLDISPLIAFECRSEALQIGHYRKEVWNRLLCEQLHLELVQEDEHTTWSVLLDLGTNDGQLNARGEYSPKTGDLQGDVYFQALNAAYIAALYAPVELTVLSGSIKLSKIKSHWSVNGQLSTQLLFDTNADMIFSNAAAEGTIQFKGSKHLFKYQLYQDNRQSLIVNGEVVCPSLSAWSLEADLRGQHVEGAWKGFGNFRGNPELQLKLTPEKAVLSGRVYLEQAELHFEEISRPYRLQRPSVYSVDMEQEHPVELFGKGHKYPVEGSIRLHLGPQVYLKAFNVDARLTGTIACIPDQGSFHLYGSVAVAQLPKGRFTGYGLKLLLEEGSILFAGPIEAALIDLRATWDEGIHAYSEREIARLRLHGNLTHPKLSSELNLQSNAYLEEQGMLDYAPVAIKNSAQYYLSSLLGLSAWMDKLSEQIDWLQLAAEPFYWGNTGMQSRLRLLIGRRLEILLRVYWQMVRWEGGQSNHAPIGASIRYYLSHEWFIDMGWIPQRFNDGASIASVLNQATSWLMELVFSKRF